jgi:hypothetical protein
MTIFIIDVLSTPAKSANEAQLQALGNLTPISILSNSVPLNSTDDDIIRAITSEYFYNTGYYMFDIDPASVGYPTWNNNAYCNIIAEVDPHAFANGIKQKALIYCQFMKAKEQFMQTLSRLKQTNPTESLYENLVGSLNHGYSLSSLYDFYEHECTISSNLALKHVFDELYIMY